MTPAQLRRRETLIARSDAALERWPGRAQPEFATEMGTVAAALEALAQAMAGDRDTVELSRTWRWAGNAYFDLAAGKERHALEQAAQAYQHAEEALANATDAQEQVKLNYCFGKTLLQLCDGKDLGLATRGAHKAANGTRPGACPHARWSRQRAGRSRNRRVDRHAVGRRQRPGSPHRRTQGRAPARRCARPCR